MDPTPTRFIRTDALWSITKVSLAGGMAAGAFFLAFFLWNGGLPGMQWAVVVAIQLVFTCIVFVAIVTPAIVDALLLPFGPMPEWTRISSREWWISTIWLLASMVPAGFLFGHLSVGAGFLAMFGWCLTVGMLPRIVWAVVRSPWFPPSGKPT